MRQVLHNYGCVITHDSQPIDLPALISLAAGATDARVREALDAAGLTGLRTRHGYVFQRLLVGPHSVTDLARALQVTQQAMSKTVAELHAHGYIDIEPDVADARRRVVSLGARGRAAVTEARSARGEIATAVGERVGPEALAVATTVIETLLAELGVEELVRARAVPDPSDD
jgi:DNA-binding MarR family transcriptional regulator